ncbi:hypothetical protein [Falsiroseomonas sp. E2-1-a4]|uniref:hypothetical protein n=1 Tax=Falsiroseomonas sp. E2-1-a4 TaxID=3239299 RepID=UPI003F3DD1D7
MIDDSEATGRLQAQIEAALPLPARPTPELLAMLRQQSPKMKLAPTCRIVAISYAGDEGGIVCKLDFGVDETGHAAYVSLTHLRFDPRLPMARAIEAYQLRRVEGLRQA